MFGLNRDAVDLDAETVVIEQHLQRVRRILLHCEAKTDASDASLPNATSLYDWVSPAAGRD